jgi:CHAT domain-containing protein
LEASQNLAAGFVKRFGGASPEWAARFRILEAESAAWRGFDPVVLGTLSDDFPALDTPEIQIRRLSLLAQAHAHLHQFNQADGELRQALEECAALNAAECSKAFEAQAGLAIERGNYQQAFGSYAQSLAVARQFGQPFDEAEALMNLAVACMLEERFDEAIDWLRASNHVAATLDAEDILLNNTGNLGWAYYRLGDRDKALGLYEDAEKRAMALGDIDGAITWITTAEYVYQDSHDLARAMSSYREALKLAWTIMNKDDIVNSLEALAHVSVEEGKLSEADGYLRQISPLMRENPNRLDVLDVMLAQGRIVAARGEDARAESIFRTVEDDPSSQTSMRLGAEHELARLYESEGRSGAAQRMYRTTLTTFESARAQLKNEDSRLPFLANATEIYDDYIHFLVEQGQTNEALDAADQSRARTLAQGLGLAANNQPFKPAVLHPAEIARKAEATLLFYWLGEKQSYLWAITPAKTVLFPLPARGRIEPLVERYRKALLGPNDAIDPPNGDGLALYRLLVEPARNLMAPEARVVVFGDGALSELNFETLIAPEPKPHYWIEDATVISAPSLYLLAAAKPPAEVDHNLLLIGDAIQPNRDFPKLPKASLEMREIERHFAGENETVFAHQRANPKSYLASSPGQYSYIHFVAHGVASSTDPLDSAIILSRANAAEDSFKLYARDIIQHPIHARLVTIAACDGSGARSYAGEGLVGLSWAFLRAGAHNVIAALWEVSDDSTPRLMDALYQGLQEGLTPSAALRRAKLELLRGQGGYRKPFFWAPFQIYTGL